jgi:hypothetical protein
MKEGVRMRLAPQRLFDSSCEASRSKIFRWWEARRLDYNIAVGVIGIITWFLVLFAGSAAVKPGVDFEEPFAMILGPPIYGILANICYTFGPIIDVVAYRGSPRVKLFKVGLIFSLVLTALPGLWAVTAWLVTLYTGQKLD